MHISKLIICTLAAIAVLSMIAFIIQGNEAARKTLAFEITGMNIYAQCGDQASIALDVTGTMTIDEVILMVAAQLQAKKEHITLSFQGTKLDPRTSVMDNALSAECKIIVTVEDPIKQYINKKFKDMAEFVECGFCRFHTETDHDKQWIRFYKCRQNRILAMDDLGYYKSFQKFQEDVNQHFVSKGFVKTARLSYIETGLEITAYYAIKKIVIKSDKDDLFVKLNEENGFEPMNAYRGCLEEFETNLKGYKIERTESDGIEMRSYAKVKKDGRLE